jgi:hypothetical protein
VDEAEHLLRAIDPAAANGTPHSTSDSFAHPASARWLRVTVN